MTEERTKVEYHEYTAHVRGETLTLKARWEPGIPRWRKWRWRLYFARAALAGKLGMLCLRVGLRAWARWLVDFESRETNRLVVVRRSFQFEEEVIARMAEDIMREEDKRIMAELNEMTGALPREDDNA